MDACDTPCEQTIAKEPIASDPYVYYAKLPTLQEMASHRVARAIWYRYMSSHSNPDNADKDSRNTLINALGIDPKYKEESVKIVESLGTPPSIEQQLLSSLKLVRRETKMCLSFFRCPSTSYLAEYGLRNFDLNWCVWLPNGKVDHLKTALVILSKPGLDLSLTQRFVILSEFCMEEEIEKISWHLLPESFVMDVTFDRDYLMYYWIYYLKDEMHEIPLFQALPGSLDLSMALKCEHYHYTAFEYFWNRLDEVDQVDIFVIMFQYMEFRLRAYIFQQRILSKMSWQQQLRLLSMAPDKILWNFWSPFRLNSPDAAMWTWKHSKNLMTPEQFTGMIPRLFEDAVPYESGIRLFTEIWHSASVQQRDHAIRTLNHELIRVFRFFQENHSKGAFQFLYLFLSKKSPDCRKDVILKKAPEIAFSLHEKDFDSMNEIIRLCLPSPEDQLEYKRVIMKSRDMTLDAQIMFREVNFEKLLFKLKAYSIDAKMTQDFVKRVVESERFDKVPFLTDVEKWNKFSQFVDDIFPQDVTSALDFKKEFISSYAKVTRRIWNDHSVDGLIKVVGMVFTDQDELLVVKKSFLDSFQKLFRDDLNEGVERFWKYCDENYFDKFVFWCLNNDEKAIAEFFNSVPVDAIFDHYFDCLDFWYGNADYEMDLDILDDLTKCLKWCCRGVEGARQYKLRRLKGFGNWGLFETIFSFTEEEPLDDVLKWFFDDNEESVSIFKAKNIDFEDDEYWYAAEEVFVPGLL